MHCVYLLKSVKTGRVYIGQTHDIKTRFKDHNAGRNKATKSEMPWKLVYVEFYKSKRDALIREKRLKRYGKSLAMLKKRISHSLTFEG